MHDIGEVLISNGVVALALALAAVLATGLRARPALVHCLWVLVLIKLVTPPIVRVPIELPVTPTITATVISPYGPPSVSGLDLSRLVPATTVPAAVPQGPARTETSALSWTQMLLGLWALGTGLALVSTWRTVRRMRLLLRTSRPAPRLQQRVAELAPVLGLARPPKVYLVPGKLSPMLWVAGCPPAVLIPEQLLPRLDQHQQTTLLAHELAHLRRRDHWVRYLEVLVRALYWWNPLVGWACRQLRNAEEQCCDAWVLWALPRASRSYANALLETVEFLSDSPAVLPVAASGVGRVQNLKRRLTMIMQAKTRRTLSNSGRGLVLGLAALALPLLPVQGQGTGELHEQNEALHKQHLHLTQLHQRMADLQLHAEHLHQQGDLHAVKQVKHEIANLHDTIDVESQNAADLQIHLQMQDHAQEQGTHTHNPKELLAALHEAIDALRDRDQEDEARVLADLAKGIMSDVEQEARTLTDRNRVIVDLERSVADRQDLHAVLEREKELTARLHVIEQDKAAEQRHLVQMDLLRREWQDVETVKRAADEAISIREDLLHRALMQGQAGTDQIRRLEARIDDLAAMVKELAEMAKKQQAEQNRRRIR